MINLKEIRDKKNLTQTQLATLTGVSQSNISKMEKGERVSINVDKLRKMASILQVDVGDLLNLQESERVGGKIIMKGIAQTGVWKAEPFFSPNEQYQVRLPEDVRFKGIPRYSVIIPGSNDNEKVSLAIYIEPQNFDEFLMPGKRYVVLRQNEQGQYETSIRRLAKAEDGKYWLLAENVDPSLLAPIPYYEGSPVVKLIGRVIMTTQTE